MQVIVRHFKRISYGLVCLCVVLTNSTVLAQDENGNVSGQPVQETRGFLDIVFAGGAVGIVIVSVLVALSITAAYLIIDHLFTVRRADVMRDAAQADDGTAAARDHVRYRVAGQQEGAVERHPQDLPPLREVHVEEAGLSQRPARR